MREILFKAKRIDNGEWVEGYLYRLSEQHNPFIMLKNKSVCQYTDIKDKNGNQIWENDIV